MPDFKFSRGQLVTVKSGTVYQIVGQRGDAHPKLKGEVGYDLIQNRNGKPYGASRLIRESQLSPVGELDDPNWVGSRWHY